MLKCKEDYTENQEKNGIQCQFHIYYLSAVR